MRFYRIWEGERWVGRTLWGRWTERSLMDQRLQFEQWPLQKPCRRHRVRQIGLAGKNSRRDCTVPKTPLSNPYRNLAEQYELWYSVSHRGILSARCVSGSRCQTVCLGMRPVETARVVGHSAAALDAVSCLRESKEIDYDLWAHFLFTIDF